MSLSKSNPEEQKPNLWKELMDKFDADREEVRKFREKYRDKCVAPLSKFTFLQIFLGNLKKIIFLDDLNKNHIP